MKKTAAKTNTMLEIVVRKKETPKATETAQSFGKFMAKKPRHLNYSNVGPSWGQRKGN